MSNRKIVLARRPHGIPVLEDFRVEETPVPEPGPGEVVVRHTHLGLAPRARIQMSDEGAAASDRMELGGVIHCAIAGEVVASNNPAFVVGTKVASVLGGWQTYSVSDGAMLNPIDTSVAPPSVWMGNLGISGFTAWVGLREIGKPQPGETIVVSSAAGAVGLVASQIAALRGARVVGIAGGAEKCRYVETHFGADVCVDYHAPDFLEQLAAACPDGIDIYFDNVGGAVRDATWPLMNKFGRVIVCGQISQYVRKDLESGPDWYPLLTKSLLVQGLSFAAFLHLQDEFIAEAGAWTTSGKLVSLEHEVVGIEQAPQAFIDMLEGRSMGKVVVALEGNPS